MTNFYGIEWFFVLYNFWGTKCYFGILDKVVLWNKKLWFGEGQKYEFLSCPLPPVCPVPETVLQIKHWTTRVVLSCPSFYSKSNEHIVCLNPHSNILISLQFLSIKVVSKKLLSPIMFCSFSTVLPKMSS